MVWKLFTPLKIYCFTFLVAMYYSTRVNQQKMKCSKTYLLATITVTALLALASYNYHLHRQLLEATAESTTNVLYPVSATIWRDRDILFKQFY